MLLLSKVAFTTSLLLPAVKRHTASHHTSKLLHLKARILSTGRAPAQQTLQTRLKTLITTAVRVLSQATPAHQAQRLQVLTHTGTSLILEQLTKVIATQGRSQWPVMVLQQHTRDLKALAHQLLSQLTAAAT